MTTRQTEQASADYLYTQERGSAFRTGESTGGNMGEKAEALKEGAKEKIYEGKEKLWDTAERAKEKISSAGDKGITGTRGEKLHSTERRYPDSMTDREAGGRTFKETAKEVTSQAANAAENAGYQAKELGTRAIEGVKGAATTVKEKLSSAPGTKEKESTTTDGAPSTQEKLSHAAHTAYEKATAAGVTISHAAQTAIEKAAPVTAAASEKLGHAAHIAKEAAVAGTATVAGKVSQAANFVKEKADVQVQERKATDTQHAQPEGFAGTAQYMKDTAVAGTATVAEKVSQAANFVKVKAEASASHDVLGDVNLSGRKIAVLAVDGYEELELGVPLVAMKAAGAQVSILSLRTGRIRGVNLHEPARRVSVDLLLKDASPSEFDALFIPGGFISPDLLRQSALVRLWVSEFNNTGKPIASICHGPWVLVSAGVTSGRTLTSWPGIRDDMVNSGATWLDQEIVKDRNLLTSRGPQDLTTFTKELLKFFSKDAHLDTTSPGTVSAPPRNEPPELVIKTMKCLPSPGLRTAVVLGALALGAAAYFS